MTNRSNPVWQMAFTAKLASFSGRDDFTDNDVIEAECFANAAVESLGEPEAQPVSPVQPQPQPRDESRDVWVFNSRNGSIAVNHETYSKVVSGTWPFGKSGERYVHYSQLEVAQRDSELLDAILRTRKQFRDAKVADMDAALELFDSALDRAIAERSKR